MERGGGTQPGIAFPLQVQHSRNGTKAEEIMKKVEARENQSPKAHPTCLDTPQHGMIYPAHLDMVPT